MLGSNYEEGLDFSQNVTKKRIAVTEQLIKKIKERTDRGDSINDIIKVTDLGRSTISKWQSLLTEKSVDECIALLQRPGPKIGANTSKYQILTEIIQQDNSLTQKGMQLKLIENDIQVSQASVSLYLKKLEITRKRLKFVAETSNSSRVISERKSYGAMYRNVDVNTMLFLDETGFNLHSRRYFGYSPKNVPAINSVPANKGRNISLLALISSRGTLNQKIISGPFNTELFMEFLNDCQKKGIFQNRIIIMDNVKFHKSNAVISFLRENNIRYGFLPPYSPQLNPIEEVFSCIKNRYYNLRPFAENSEQICQYIISVINQMNEDVNFSVFYENMKKYLDLAFLGRKLELGSNQ